MKPSSSQKSAVSIEQLIIKNLSYFFSTENKYVLLVRDEAEGEQVKKLLEPFVGEEEVVFMPHFFQVGSYRFESVKKVVSERLYTLSHLLEHQPKVVITTPLGLMRLCPSVEWLRHRIQHIEQGSEIDLDTFIEHIKRLCYVEVPQVESVGDFAIRGGILDIWVSGDKYPSRLEVNDDFIDKIRIFSKETQVSFKTLESLTIRPAREFSWPQEKIVEAMIERFNRFLLEQKVAGTQRADFLDNVRYGFLFPGIDDLSYMFMPESSYEPFLSFLEKTGDAYRLLSLCPQSSEVTESLEKGKELYRDARDKAFHKNYLVPQFSALYEERSFPAEQVSFISHQEKEEQQKKEQALFSFLEKIKKFSFAEKIEHLMEAQEEGLCQQIFLTGHSPDLLSQIAKAVTEIVPTQVVSNLKSFLETSFKNVEKSHSQNSDFNKGLEKKENQTSLFLNCLYPLESYAYCETNQILFVSSDWLRNRMVHRTYEEDQTTSTQREQIQRFLDRVQEFSPGDLVVHVQYGVGKFSHLAHFNEPLLQGDFLVIEYADKDKIYVPVDKMNLVQRFIGQDNADLDSIRSKSWTKKKEKAKEDAEKFAKFLIEEHAKRALSPGFAFSPASELYQEFELAFPFEDTDDQKRASQEIMNDMTASKPMDRLLCGDVGFGKTELAMRAAYRATLDSKQIAWVVPTTVLAHQHFRSLKERFEKFPVRIALFDRSVNAKETASILNGLKTGQIDIIVGTHRLFSETVEFYDLGLLILDEEQRFGVLQKEKIKKFSYGVDVLTMSATPIPRTLQLAMIGLKDLSLLTTPPKLRLPIKTRVCAFDSDVIKEAISFEVKRGGQVFYLHNRTEELESVRTFLQAELPEYRIEIGHGKMTQKDLEKVIINFIDGKFHILLCTTIIESGIDMPNVNTILVQNADQFGLSQLYQIRGRVGRRSTQGFAYLLKSPEAEKEDDGMKRLQILSDHQALGSGFLISTHDLEMRGSGNIVGAEQSGKSHEVGFGTYTELLNQAVSKLKGEEDTVTVPDIELPLQTSISSSYIANEKERIRIYRRFFTVVQEKALNTLVQECEDRFGPISQEVFFLSEISRLRRFLVQIHGHSLTVGEASTEIRFNPKLLNKNSDQNDKLIAQIFKAVESSKGFARMTPDGRLILSLKKKDFIVDKAKESLGMLKNFLSSVLN